MRSRAKSLLLALISVLVAVLLVFAGMLLGSLPSVERGLRSFLDTLGIQQAGEEAELDTALQQEIFDVLESRYYKDFDSEAVNAGAVDGMLAGLDDTYSSYLSPDEYSALKEQLSGEYEGIGAGLLMIGRLVTVVVVYDDTPAAEAGLEVGDIIVSVDGVSTSGKTSEEVVSEIRGPGGTKVRLEIYRRASEATDSEALDEQGEAGQGGVEDSVEEEVFPADQTADLSGLPEGGDTSTYTLTRRSIVIPDTDSEILQAGGKKVAHITLYSFANRLASEQLRSEVEKALEEEEVDAIILDLRPNLGGIVDEAVDVAGMFIEDGVVTSYEGLHQPEKVYYAEGDAYEDVPLYVLVGEDSASASEILAGALQDYGRATLVGETTFGKSFVTSVIPLSNGGAVNVIIAVYVTPKGREIGGEGIDPDVLAPDDPATADVDETLEKALELIASAPDSR